MKTANMRSVLEAFHKALEKAWYDAPPLYDWPVGFRLHFEADICVEFLGHDQASVTAEVRICT